MLDEYHKGVHFSPDGLCLLTCVESGGGGTRTTADNRQPQPRKRQRKSSANKEAQEEHKRADNSSRSSSSSSSSSSSDSSSDSSESESEDEAKFQARNFTETHTRGLFLYELPQMQWRDRSEQHCASSYGYAPIGAAAAVPAATACAPMKPTLHASPGDSIYDFLWNPGMSSAVPATCWFVSTARSNPIHLWDAFTGKLRASYAAYNHVDEMESAISLAIEPAAIPGSSDDAAAGAAMDQPTRLYAGYNKTIRIFDLNRPGRECTTLVTGGKAPKKTISFGRRGSSRGSSGGGLGNLRQNGIISALEINPLHRTLLVAGSYSGEIGLYDLSSAHAGYSSSSGLEHKVFLDPHGVSQVKFSSDGMYLFVGLRHSEEIAIFDMRNASTPLSKLRRANGTNQKLIFDLEKVYSSRWIASGDSTGNLLMWDLLIPPDPDTLVIEPVLQQKVAADAVNGVSMHPQWSTYVPIIATVSGQRQFFFNTAEEPEEEKIEEGSGLSAQVPDSHKRKFSPEVGPQQNAGPDELVNALAVWSIEHRLVDSTAQTESAGAPVVARCLDQRSANLQ
jgi:WD40 repeat protein